MYSVQVRISMRCIGLALLWHQYTYVHICTCIIAYSSRSSSMMLFVYSFDNEVYSEWSSVVDRVANASLEKSLLTRDPVVMHLTINFDPEVIMI